MNQVGHADEQPLIELGRMLKAVDYRFTAVTPATHRRVNGRAGNEQARDLAGVFGWSRPFRPSLLAVPMTEMLRHAGELVEREDGLLESAIRFSSLGDDLYAHSSFPTDASDAVFFGPDTYRFAAALSRRARPAPRALDVCCGSGAGGLSLRERVEHLTLTDINPRALRLARVNVALAGRRDVELAVGDLLAPFDGDFDLIVANPPYIADAAGRVYRNGGGAFGTALSRRIVAESLPRLRAGGQLILYTGAPILGGEDLLRRDLGSLLDDRALSVEYEELDPDVFGEELEQAGYAAIERIAVVCIDITRRAP